MGLPWPKNTAGIKFAISTLSSSRVEYNRPVMSKSGRMILALIGSAAAFFVVPQGNAQPNSQPNPYRTVENWFQLPEGRTMGSTSAVFFAPGGHIWVAERCGANSSAAPNLAPVL